MQLGSHVATLVKHVSRTVHLNRSTIPNHLIQVIDAALGEILTTCSKMEWLLNHGQAALRPERRHSNLVLAYKKSEVHYQPLGVVAAIVSWNYRS